MNARRFFAVATTGLLFCCAAAAQDIELEFSESTLNDIVAQLGDLSKGGVYQRTYEIPGLIENCEVFGYLDCPALGPAPPGLEMPHQLPLFRCRRKGQVVVSPGFEPISWQWWITGARFDVTPSGLQFTAAVRYRVGNEWEYESRTVPATLKLDANGEALKISISNYKVQFEIDSGAGSSRSVEVDVGRHLSLEIPLQLPTFTVAKLSGGTKTFSAKIRSAATHFSDSENIRISANVGFD